MRARGNAFAVWLGGPQQFASNVIGYLQLTNADGWIRKDVAAAFYAPALEKLRRLVRKNTDARILELPADAHRIRHSPDIRKLKGETPPLVYYAMYDVVF